MPPNCQPYIKSSYTNGSNVKTKSNKRQQTSKSRTHNPTQHTNPPQIIPEINVTKANVYAPNTTITTHKEQSNKQTTMQINPQNKHQPPNIAQNSKFLYYTNPSEKCKTQVHNSTPKAQAPEPPFQSSPNSDKPKFKTSVQPPFTNIKTSTLVYASSTIHTTSPQTTLNK